MKIALYGINPKGKFLLRVVCKTPDNTRDSVYRDMQPLNSGSCICFHFKPKYRPNDSLKF